MNAAETVLKLLANEGGAHRFDNAADLRLTGPLTYAVLNGPNVLQVGHGSHVRAKRVMRGGSVGKHAKAFVCAIAEVALGGPNRYAAVARSSRDDAKALEESIHRELGIKTNVDAAAVVDGVDGRSLSALQLGLWEMAKRREPYLSLTENERRMAGELFDLVNYGTTRIERTSKVVSSRYGDNLEGNILMNIGRSHLANVFEKLTGAYLKYGKHRLDDAAFQDALAEYAYTPHPCKHVVDVSRKRSDRVRVTYRCEASCAYR